MYKSIEVTYNQFLHRYLQKTSLIINFERLCWGVLNFVEKIMNKLRMVNFDIKLKKR